jgi:hypothetical protein
MIRDVFLQPRDTMAETFCSICRNPAKHGSASGLYEPAQNVGRTQPTTYHISRQDNPSRYQYDVGNITVAQSLRQKDGFHEGGNFLKQGPCSCQQGGQ